MVVLSTRWVKSTYNMLTWVWTFYPHFYDPAGPLMLTTVIQSVSSLAKIAQTTVKFIFNTTFQSRKYKLSTRLFLKLFESLKANSIDCCRLQIIIKSQANISLLRANPDRQQATSGWGKTVCSDGVCHLDKLVQTLLQAVSQSGIPVQLVRHYKYNKYSS